MSVSMNIEHLAPLTKKIHDYCHIQPFCYGCVLEDDCKRLLSVTATYLHEATNGYSDSFKLHQNEDFDDVLRIIDTLEQDIECKTVCALCHSTQECKFCDKITNQLYELLNLLINKIEK